MSLISYQISDQIATITLDRPDKCNALSKPVIQDLIATAGKAAADDTVRLIVLQGAGPHFCAGADLEWMKSAITASREENLRDAELIAELMSTFAGLSKPLLARVHGSAIGAGVGLVATADIVVADAKARFGFSEVQRGIIPLVVAPYVMPKIGVSHARRYFLTGERIDAATAQRVGLVHEVVPETELDTQVSELCRQLLAGGPHAVIAAKQMVRDIADPFPPAKIEVMMEQLADLRTTPEAQEGISAFLERRAPVWARNN